MKGVDLEAVGSQKVNPVTVAGMVFDASSGPRDAGDVALGAQQPVTGDPTFIGYAEGDRHAVGQEHQSSHRSQESGGLREPDRGLTPGGGAVLADHEVEHATAQWDLAGVGFDQREEQVVVLLTSPGGVELGRAQVDGDRACTSASEARRQERGATAELDDVETPNVTDESELGFGQPEQSPADPVRRPLVVGVGVREPFVHE